MTDLNRSLDIWLSVVGGILIAVTLALVLLVVGADGESRFDPAPPATTAESDL